MISWDGEEPGLIGSFEFTELHDKVLRTQAVVYLNLDTAVRTSFFFFLKKAASNLLSLREMATRH